MMVLARHCVWALLIMLQLAGVAAWGDSGEIPVQSRSLGKPRRAGPFSSALEAPGAEAAPREHVEPRVNVSAGPMAEAPGLMSAAINSPTRLQSPAEAGI